MSKIKLILLSFISGLLLAASWPHFGITAIIFFAWAPLLAVEEFISDHKADFSGAFLFMCSYITFFTWNVLTTWWIWNASGGGAAMAILANALLMATVFYIFHIVKHNIKKLFPAVNKNLLRLLLIAFWISFEFLHLDWDLTYPWLTLGNIFSETHTWIQWYEYTGVFGGSLWILLVNIIIYNLLFEIDLSAQKKYFANIIPVVLLIIVPIIISLFIYNSTTDNGETKNVVVVQPNVDPYNMKFDIPAEDQLKEMLELAATKVNANTDYLVFPETAIPEGMWEDELGKEPSLLMIKDFLKQFPKLKIVTGATTRKEYRAGEKASATARKFKDSDGSYDEYNTGLQLDSSGTIQVYHKSKLVPGVEKMPFPSIFKYIEKFAIDLGGTGGSLGVQDERSVFNSLNDNTKIAPVICYESIYGEYVSDYINNGANAIFIITNDGWWGDTPGYKQHLRYGRLRAIETRKSIARSANTGISCFIDQRGDISQATNWWVPAIIEGEIKVNDQKTFYTKHGDYIARFLLLFSVIAIAIALIGKIRLLRSN